MRMREVLVASRRSSLTGHIKGVVFGRSQKQMLWSYASGRIAAMANEHAFGYRSVVKFIRNTMRPSVLPVDGQASVIPKSARGPQPAPIGFSDLSPKAQLPIARFHRFASMCASMMRRTSSAIDIPRRFASRIKNVLCGSVNEIICLVIGCVYVQLCQPLGKVGSTERAKVNRIFHRAVRGSDIPSREVITILVAPCPQFYVGVIAITDLAVSAFMRSEIQTFIFSRAVLFGSLLAECQSAFWSDQERNERGPCLFFEGVIRLVCHGVASIGEHFKDACFHVVSIPQGIHTMVVAL